MLILLKGRPIRLFMLETQQERNKEKLLTAIEKDKKIYTTNQSNNIFYAFFLLTIICKSIKLAKYLWRSSKNSRISSDISLFFLWSHIELEGTYR